MRYIAIELKIACTFLVGIMLFMGCAKEPEQATQQESDQTTMTDSAVFDSVLANNLGADDYGMKAYVMAFLMAGPTPELDSAKAVALQRAHLDNIFRLADEGKLVLAGPFMDGGSIRGIYIFNVSSVEEAKALTSTDPAIQSGSLKMELHPWYGSAGLGLLNDWHKKIQKVQI